MAVQKEECKMTDSMMAFHKHPHIDIEKCKISGA